MRAIAVAGVHGLVERFAAMATWHIQAIRAWGQEHWMLAPVLLGLILGLVWATWWGSRPAAVLLLPLVAGWLLFNGPIEGPVLLLLDGEHGVSLADLLSVVALVTAGWCLVWRGRPRAGSAGAPAPTPAAGAPAPTPVLSAGWTATRRR